MTPPETERWEERPTPKLYPETERFWRVASERRLVVKQCRQCDLLFHYPRNHCPDCFAADTEWIETA